MLCLWGGCCFDNHNSHLCENKSGLYITSDCGVMLCCSIRTDSSSQNPKGNNSGKNHGFMYQNVGNDRRQEPLHTERKARCAIHDAQHIMWFLSQKQTHVFIYCTCALILRFIRGAPARSADWESTDIDVREQTARAALVQNGNTDHFVNISM